MSKIDKIISVFSPEKALKRTVARQRFEIINQGYGNYGASKVKKAIKGWNYRGGSAKEDIEDNIETLRERSRDLYMGGASLATGALKKIRTNAVGAGLKLKSQVDADFLGLTEDEADRLERQIEREFNFWAESQNCDAARMNDFYDLQSLVLLSYLMSGDCFALLPTIKRENTIYDTRVMVIEADRVCNPKGNTNKKIINGVEIGKYGEVVAYHIAEKHPLSDDSFKNKWIKVNAYGKKTGRRNVLHILETERPEQRRGIPLLSSVITPLKQLGQYSEAELTAAVIASFFTVFIKSESEDGVPELVGEGTEEDEEIEQEEVDYKLGSGSIVGLGEGEDIVVADPKRPNSSFEAFITAISREIGTAIEMPYEVLVNHFQSSYSASRAALLEAWKMFKMRRIWIAKKFCQPVFEEVLAEAVAKGRINAPGFFTDPLIRKAYSGTEWNGPSQGQLDPLKEVKAAEQRVSNGFSTRAKETVELTGGDFNKNIKQRIKEEKMMQEIPTINEEGGKIIESN